MFTSCEILGQLNACAGVMRRFAAGTFDGANDVEVLKAGVAFPDLLEQEGSHMLASRLSACADANSWALVIEDVRFEMSGSEGQEVVNRLYCYGDTLRGRPGSHDGGFLFPVPNPRDNLVFVHGEYVRPEAQFIRIGSRAFAVLTDSGSYARARVVPQEATIRGHELIRALVALHPEAYAALLATDEELHARLMRPLPVLLSLSEWNHPVIEEWPGNHETFQMLAEVMVTRDPSRYRPRRPPNNTWRTARSV